jgi:hypothetical protein
MNIRTEKNAIQKCGGIAIIAGALLLALYAVLFPILLPVQANVYERVINANWLWLAIIAFAGVLSMLAGFYAVHLRLRQESGTIGTIGFLFIALAYILQACKVSWEIFLYPIISRHAESAFLLRDAIIKQDPAMIMFKWIAAAAILIGTTLFCCALYRSKQFPKVAALLIFIGAVVYGVAASISIYVSVAGIFTFATGCFLIGIRLIRSQ